MKKEEIMFIAMALIACLIATPFIIEIVSAGMPVSAGPEMAAPDTFALEERDLQALKQMMPFVPKEEVKRAFENGKDSGLYDEQNSVVLRWGDLVACGYIVCDNTTAQVTKSGQERLTGTLITPDYITDLSYTLE